MKRTLSKAARRRREKFRKSFVHFDPRKGTAAKLTKRTVLLDLPEVKYTRKTARETRLLVGASQEVFARFMGVKVTTVRTWEQGIHQPSETACRLLDEIRHDPRYWQRRFKEAFREKDGD